VEYTKGSTAFTCGEAGIMSAELEP
jgi:hypothetical protein